jgi:hypothetical protein
VWSVLFEDKEKMQNQVYGTPMKVIMDRNLDLRKKLFCENVDAVKLMTALVHEFIIYVRKQGAQPVFVLLPQKDDVLEVKNNRTYYHTFIQNIQEELPTLDLTRTLVNHNDLDALYSDDNKYGGHFSAQGNALVAKEVHDFITAKQLL